MALKINITKGENREQPNANDKASYPGMSPLKAALLYGGAGALVGGPLGLITGLAAGITAKRERDNYLDKQAAFALEQSQFNNEIRNEFEIADPDEARLLGHAKRVADAGWQRLAAGDPTGREMVENANAFIAQIINGDREARKQEQTAQIGFQRQLIGNAAEDYRKQYQTHVTDFETVNSNVARVLDLTAQEDFDPNKPFNKAILAELLSTGIGGFYRDAPNALDGLAQGFSGLPGPVGTAAGGIAGGLATAINSKDFKLTREDFNRIAFSMKKIAQETTEKRMQRLSAQAVRLDDFARKTGAIPVNYSLGDYISGGTKDLKIQQVPKQPTAKLTAPTMPESRRGPNNINVPSFIFNQPKVKMTRPVN